MNIIALVVALVVAFAAAWIWRGLVENPEPKKPLGAVRRKKL